MATALWSFSDLAGLNFRPLAFFTPISSSLDSITRCTDTHRVTHHVKWIIRPARPLQSYPSFLCNHYTSYMDCCEIVLEYRVAMPSHISGQSHAYTQRTQDNKGWISPDGIQAMWNVRLESKLRYGPTEEFSVDILNPISPSKCFVSDSKSVRSTPVIYAHGGAHMCVRGVRAQKPRVQSFHFFWCVTIMS